MKTEWWKPIEERFLDPQIIEPRDGAVKPCAMSSLRTRGGHHRPALLLIIIAAIMLAATVGGAMAVAAAADNQPFIDPYAVIIPEQDVGPVLEVGAPFEDAQFGTNLVRLTDAIADGCAWTEHEYSRADPFNKDGSYFILLPGCGEFVLYDGTTGEPIKPLHGILLKSEPRWSRHDPGLLYFVDGNGLYSFHVETEELQTIAQFDEYEVVFSGGEQDLSEDGEHFALMGGESRSRPEHVFVVNLATGRKGAVLDISGAGNIPNNVAITPDNNVLINWNPPGGNDRYRGVELYDGEMGFVRQVLPFEGHADIGRDVDGSEILVITNSADPQPYNGEHWIVKVRLSDSQITPLVRLDWRLAAHVSMRNIYSGGWALVSTYSPSNPRPSSGDWKPLENEILAVALDGSEQVRRLGHTRSMTIGDYTYQARAVVRGDGQRVIFTSNFGLNSGRSSGLSSDYVDVYMLSVPPIPFAVEKQPLPGDDEPDNGDGSGDGDGGDWADDDDGLTDSNGGGDDGEGVAVGEGEGEGGGDSDGSGGGDGGGGGDDYANDDQVPLEQGGYDESGGGCAMAGVGGDIGGGSSSGGSPGPVMWGALAAILLWAAGHLAVRRSANKVQGPRDKVDLPM